MEIPFGAPDTSAWLCNLLTIIIVNCGKCVCHGNSSDTAQCGLTCQVQKWRDPRQFLAWNCHIQIYEATTAPIPPTHLNHSILKQLLWLRSFQSQTHLSSATAKNHSSKQSVKATLCNNNNKRRACMTQSAVPKQQIGYAVFSISTTYVEHGKPARYALFIKVYSVLKQK